MSDDLARTTNQEPGASRWVSIDGVLALLAVLWGALANSNKLLDNSFMTHLATGRLILDDGAVPSTDPYSFTAEGADWTVQSWLPSVIYATAERIGGVGGLRLVGMALGGVAAWVIWRLTCRCTSLLPRLALLFGTLSITTSLWGMRPYMFGVIGLGLVWLIAVDHLLPTWTLVPIFWVWANSHGSFPLGLGLLVLLAVGTRLDGDTPATVVPAMGFGILGTLSAAIGPLGLRVLSFPLTVLERSDELRRIREWQPADMADLYERLYLVVVIVAIVSLIRRPSWGLGLPAIAFVVMGMIAQRNLALATLVLVPVIASGVGELGELRTTARPRTATVAAAFLVVAGIAATGVLAARPLTGIGGYPEEPIAFLGPGVRMAAPDFVGNVLEVLDGPETPVFIDDRVDMYPSAVLDDSNDLVLGSASWATVLERYDLDLIAWQRGRPLGGLLAADDRWQVTYSDEIWVVACRRGTCP